MVSITPEKQAIRGKRTLQNRLNDLTWKEWLLFQKSFFDISHDELLLRNLIEFFTKKNPRDGEPSHILILSIDSTLTAPSLTNRTISTEILNSTNLNKWSIQDYPQASFDFLLIDMRNASFPTIEENNALPEQLLAFYTKCRTVLRPNSFCVILSQEIESQTAQQLSRYPIPWLLSSLARASFRLRDEKIGISTNSHQNILYVNILQAIDEIGPGLPPAQSMNIAIGAAATPIQWVIPRPKQRQKKEILHPAKFPEELVERFLHQFSKPGAIIFDPMGGTGSVAVAALQTQRIPVLIELNELWADIARERIATVASPDVWNEGERKWTVIVGDARFSSELLAESSHPIDYTITSPPYWHILHNRGMHEKDEGQQARLAKGLATTYSTNENDLGNIKEYAHFLDELVAIYENVRQTMLPGSYFTIVTKNVKHKRAVYPIAWDLVFRLCHKDTGHFEYAGTTFWCQDDIRLKPFGMGCDWVSNILHHYCIHLRVR